MTKYNQWNKSEAQTSPTTDETFMAYMERMKHMSSNTRNMYQEQHRQKHFCHYGPFPCWLCPLWDALDTITSNAPDIVIALAQINKEIIYTKDEKGLLNWQIVPTRRPLRSKTKS